MTPNRCRRMEAKRLVGVTWVAVAPWARPAPWVSELRCALRAQAPFWDEPEVPRRRTRPSSGNRVEVRWWARARAARAWRASRPTWRSSVGASTTKTWSQLFIRSVFETSSVITLIKSWLLPLHDDGTNWMSSKNVFNEEIGSLQKLNINLVFVPFMIVFGSSFLFGYNIGVLNQPTTVSKTSVPLGGPIPQAN